MDLSKTAKQVVVLSHETAFLRLVWSASSKTETRTLKLSRLGETVQLIPWDIDAETTSDYDQNYNDLKLYLDNNSGKPRAVVRCIRPLLEGHLRRTFPRQFRPKEWLGDFIAHIRDADSLSPLHVAQALLPGLDSINDYSKGYHHETDSNLEEDPHPDETELRAFVKRTLTLVRTV